MTWDTFASTPFLVALALVAAAAVALSARGRVEPWPTVALVGWLVASGLWAVALVAPPLSAGEASCDATLVEAQSSGAADCVDAARSQLAVGTMTYLALVVLGSQYVARRPGREDGDTGGAPQGAGAGSMRNQFHNK